MIVAYYKCDNHNCSKKISAKKLLSKCELPSYVLEACPFIPLHKHVWTKQIHSVSMGRTIDGTSAGQLALDLKRLVGERWVSLYFQYLSHVEYYNNNLVTNRVH